MNIKFRLLLPFITFIIILSVFFAKLLFDEKKLNDLEIVNDTLYFNNLKSCFIENEIINFKKNNGYVIVNFFSPNCKQCVRDLEEFKYLKEHHIKAYVVIVIDNNYEINWQNHELKSYFADGIVINNKTYQKIGYNIFPTTILLQNNKIVHKFEGKINHELMHKIIKHGG